MTMNLSRHRKSIEKLYTDRATIMNYIKQTKSNGATELNPDPTYDNVPCRISQKSLATNKQSVAENNIQYETKLFMAPEIDIKQGTEIVVTRGNVTRTYQAGESFPYPTHQEISLQRKEYA